MTTTFPGYRRPDGQVGVRNHILVIPTAICSSRTAEAIAEGLPAVVIPHEHGCHFDSRANENLERLLIRLGRSPNVAAALVVSLGCESASMERITAGIAESGKPVEGLRIQEVGGTIRTITRGREIVERFARDTAALKPEPCGAEELILAVECGGSDAFSGLSANPAVGAAVDLLIDDGGTVIFSETGEMVGAEHLLARRAVDEETRRRLLHIVGRAEGGFRNIEAHSGGVYIAVGNLAGGLTTIEEKSLGCIHKGGTRPLVEVIGYTDRPTRRGLVIMDSTGHDVASVIGKVAGGAQVVCFTTGRGTPTGCPIAPVIKVCSNSDTSRHMADNVDVDAGTILTGEESIAQVGRRIYEVVMAVAAGERTKTEILGHREFAVASRAPIPEGVGR
ncbi:MAG: UxaA family hydrolase [Armatimonadetes bacterium]|nr:UxaA family hydrolase [Armatimonadota bacterium]